MTFKQSNNSQDILGCCSKEFSTSLLVSAGLHIAIIMAFIATHPTDTLGNRAATSTIQVTLVNIAHQDTLELKSDPSTNPQPIDNHSKNTIEPATSNDSVDLKRDASSNILTSHNNSVDPIHHPQKSSQQDQSSQTVKSEPKMADPVESKQAAIPIKPTTTPVDESSSIYGTPDRKPKPINLQIPIAPSSLDGYIDSAFVVAKVSVDFEGKPLRVDVAQTKDGSPALPLAFIETIEKLLMATKYAHAMKGGSPSNDIFVVEISIASGKVILAPELTINLDAQTKDLNPPETTMRRR